MCLCGQNSVSKTQNVYPTCIRRIGHDGYEALHGSYRQRTPVGAKTLHIYQVRQMIELKSFQRLNPCSLVNAWTSLLTVVS